MPTCVLHEVAYPEGEVCPMCRAAAPPSVADDWFSWTCLAVGWLVSVVASGLSVVNMLLGIDWIFRAAKDAERSGLGSGLVPLFRGSIATCIISGVVGFFFFAGLAIVFARTMRYGPPRATPPPPPPLRGPGFAGLPRFPSDGTREEA